jgi:hypothetical protein
MRSIDFSALLRPGNTGSQFAGRRLGAPDGV